MVSINRERILKKTAVYPDLLLDIFRMSLYAVSIKGDMNTTLSVFISPFLFLLFLKELKQ